MQVSEDLQPFPCHSCIRIFSLASTSSQSVLSFRSREAKMFPLSSAKKSPAFSSYCHSQKLTAAPWPPPLVSKDTEFNGQHCGPGGRLLPHQMRLQAPTGSLAPDTQPRSGPGPEAVPISTLRTSNAASVTGGLKDLKCHFKL